MTIKDDDQIRAWCVDYAIRLGNPKVRAKPQQILADAALIERYITARPPCEIALIQPTAKRKLRT